MILENSYDIVNSICSYLEDNDVTLVPTENTYLKSLYSTMASINNSNLESAHDIVQDKVINVLSNSIISQLQFIKNEVIPTVDSFYDKLKETIKSYLSSNSLLDINIVPLKMPNFVYHEDFSRTLEHYKNILPNEPIQINGIPKVSEDIMNSVREAASRYYLDNYNDSDGVSAIFNNLSESAIYHSSRLTNKVTATQNHAIVDEALTKYFLADILSKNESLALDIYNVSSLDSLRNILTSVKQYSLAIIARNKDIIESRINHGKGLLVLNFDKSARLINVDKIVYDNFINAGGSPEVILGLFSDNKATPADYFYDNLIASKEKYLSYYEQYSRLEEENRKLNHFDSFKTFFRLLFLNEVSNYSQFEKDFHDINPGSVEKIINLLDEKLRKLVLDDIKDPDSTYKTISEIITSTRYYYTDAYTIMKYIDEEHGGNTDISSTVAIAVIYYLVDYFVDQFYIHYNK